MSAFVTYSLKAIDRHGEVIGKRDVRAVCMPTRDECLALVREQFGEDATAVEAVRSVPAKIGRITPASRLTVSARVKVLA